jgi:putative component of toxin-antitoxin plasmid stabilization module
MIDVRQTDAFANWIGTLVVLLAGGDKRTQARDIQTALELAREL